MSVSVTDSTDVGMIRAALVFRENRTHARRTRKTWRPKETGRRCRLGCWARCSSGAPPQFLAIDRWFGIAVETLDNGRYCIKLANRESIPHFKLDNVTSHGINCENIGNPRRIYGPSTTGSRRHGQWWRRGISGMPITIRLP
jgi:hypothetical protein